MKTHPPLSLALLIALALTRAPSPAASVQVLEDPTLRLTLIEENGACEVIDKRTGVAWGSAVGQPRFGAASILVDGKPVRFDLGKCRADARDNLLRAQFEPVPELPGALLTVSLRLREQGRLEVECAADDRLPVQELAVLDGLFTVTAAQAGCVVLPVREGVLVPAASGKEFTHRFDTYAYEGCHMAMAGVVREGSALLLHWSDPYVALDLQSRANNLPDQTLRASLVLRQSARQFAVEFLGQGDHVTIGQAYRAVARQKGWRVTWDQKLPGHPDRAKLFGAINYKLWSVLDRQMNEDGSREQSSRVNWTFAESAAVAEHLKRDLELDKVLFSLGGWIHRGYDNQHPDILPAAPECGGDAAFADCAKRVMDLGYLFCLHDNYQDIYRDSPSWDEKYIMRTSDGSLARGGHWAGGVAFLTCSRQALELAQRPRNLAAVRELTHANAYFIDTTYAAGLQECFSPDHPLRRQDDLHWKQALSDYARSVFGVFGSECGREWAVPHSDFFEGITGVSGGHFHDTKLLEKVGGTVIPLFEMVYRDGMALYGKYGYDPANAAGYVLHHILIGRPLNYHSIPPHLYWQSSPQAEENVSLRPAVANVTSTGPRRFRITYSWTADRPISGDYRVFVHFAESAETILFQNDHTPQPPLNEWKGTVNEGPFDVTVPEKVNGRIQVRMGLFSPKTGERLRLEGSEGAQSSYLVGHLNIAGDAVQFEPLPAAPAPSGDPALFVAAGQGWAEGLHPMDRFVKNTYEILSPLHELTARQLITAHQFLTRDKAVQKTTFGVGKDAVISLINTGPQPFPCRSRLGGDLLLPPNGFLVEAPEFVAFHSLKWNGKSYSKPVLFTLRSLDGQRLATSKKVKVFHASGDPSIRVNEAEFIVQRQAVVP